MKCSWEQKLSAYWDGELTPNEQACVERHLHGCQHCQVTLAIWQRLRQSLQQESLPTSPIAVAATLERLKAEGAFRPTSWRSWLHRLDEWFMRPSIAFKAAMAMALVLALLLVNGLPPLAQATERMREKVQQAVQRLPSLLRR